MSRLASVLRLSALSSTLLVGSLARAQEAEAPQAPPDAPAPAPVPAAAPAARPEALLPEDDGESGFVQVDESQPNLSGVEEGPKLDIYGFADFSYVQLLVEDDSEWLIAYQEHGSFFVGHLNLYFSGELDERWRTLMEIRFSYLPHGEENPSQSGAFVRQDTTVNDYAEFEKPNRWGGIIIERAWLEYSPFDFLSIRAGQWLTPYGFWNEDHGSPTIIPVHRPFVIGDGLFPERQTGLEAHGKAYVDATAVGYHLTLSNGRGPIDSYRDLDANKALGGRLFVQAPVLGQTEFGGAVYRGRYTDSHRVAVIDNSGPTPVLGTDVIRDVSYEELSLAGDLRVQFGELLVQGEIVMNEVAYDDDARPPVVGVDPTFHEGADYRRWGTYGLVGYRTPFFGLMPYVLGEYHNFAGSSDLAPMFAVTAGVNLRPTSNVVLKAEFSTVDFDGAGSNGLGDEPLRVVSTQAAWAF